MSNATAATPVPPRSGSSGGGPSSSTHPQLLPAPPPAQVLLTSERYFLSRPWRIGPNIHTWVRRLARLGQQGWVNLAAA